MRVSSVHDKFIDTELKPREISRNQMAPKVREIVHVNI
jgi:hypothetical protein